jgi:sensor histidine kinase YesM
MILQPIAENAVEHGISAKAGAIVVAIVASVDDDWLRIRVQDCGPGFATAARRSRGHGVGLANTTQRLQQLYGRDHSIRCSDSPGGGATVDLIIPLARPVSDL